MTLQSPQTSEFPDSASTLQFGLESCPTCGQEIPPDKIKEIGGRIAAKQREQTRAISAQLEKQYVIERTAAEVRAKGELESERQRSAARETRVREEAQKAAEKLISDRQAEAEQARNELVAGWQQQLAEAESARKSAEQTEVNLQVQMKELRESSASALEAIQVRTKQREIEIENEAKRNAESVIAERVAALEAAQRESEAGLQARINEAEASRIAAEQKEAAVQLQLEKLREASAAEAAKIKEDAAKEATRIRQVATETAEVRFRDTLATQERAVAEANAKTREAEQHASEMEQNLKTQREILEQAKEDAVNAAKAKAFEENQKLSTKVNDLQRALDKQTNEELGEGAEINIFEALKSEFKDDRIERIPKGAPGADIRHIVMLHGQECGTILYDSKNHKHWRDEHAAKLRKDQLAEKAEHAILSTHKFPRDAHQLHHREGVLLANPARVVAVATIIRQHLLQMHTLRVSKVERESKTAALYEFIISARCKQLLDRIDQRTGGLLELQEKEIRWHEKNWEHQGTAIRAVQKAKIDLAGEIDSIIGTSMSDGETSEAS